MAVEEVHERVRRKLVELVGMEAADWLLDRPPGGWSELVTKDWLHLELAVLEAKFEGKFETLDERFVSIATTLTSLDTRLGSIEKSFRGQTWRLIGAMTGLITLLAVVIKL